MKKNLIIYIAFIGLIGLLSSCKKEETRVIALSNPVAPTLVTLPNLTLQRTSGADTIIFVGTPVDPGFVASATYFLEACPTGNNFANSILLYSGIQDTQIKLSISELNGLLLKSFPSDSVSSVDFRIRTVLVVDAGTGSIGTSIAPLVYSSGAVTAQVTVYGLPRLDLINSGIVQKIESALGDGSYTGYVKLDATKPFTLKDPDANIVYGANGAALAVNGTGISTGTTGSGWYILSANTKTLTYSLTQYMIGLIGDATPNGWNSPDQKMDYNYQTGLWYITLNLTVGSVKIRANDTWGSINLGLGDASHPQYTLTNLWNNGSSQNIPIAAAGNYTVNVFIGTSTYSCTITKNN
ncbi:MAG: SusE domain-containing protein [Bacteroidales bacterium]